MFYNMLGFRMSGITLLVDGSKRTQTRGRRRKSGWGEEDNSSDFFFTCFTVGVAMHRL